MATILAKLSTWWCCRRGRFSILFHN